MTQFELVAVPRTHWENANDMGIAALVTDALGCERRIQKEVNLANEYGRYTSCCYRLDQCVTASDLLKPIKNITDIRSTLRVGRFPVWSLGPEYIMLLARAKNIAGERLGKSFFPPDALPAHTSAFKLWMINAGWSANAVAQQRLAFLEAATKADCGIIELQSCFHASVGEAPAVEEIAEIHSDEPGQSFIEIPPVAMGEDASFFSVDRRKQNQARILREDIWRALQARQPVSFGNRASHDVITEVLNEFAFVPKGQTSHPASIRVVYADGSEARPFPLFALARRHKNESGVAPLRAALMSMRHLDLDKDIDFCWFRNREVSRSRTLAEADEFCFKTTLNQLNSSMAQGALMLHLFHTGFEPAVMGFYRALVQFLANDNKGLVRLEIVPFYFRSHQPYERGTAWSG
jgi:hypothetical protein